MKEITIEDVRAALLEQEIFTESELADISDDVLKGQSFRYDLEMDSLDCIIFAIKLAGENNVSSFNLQILDDETVGDFLARCEKMNIYI